MPPNLQAQDRRQVHSRSWSTAEREEFDVKDNLLMAKLLKLSRPISLVPSLLPSLWCGEDHLSPLQLISDHRCATRPNSNGSDSPEWYIIKFWLNSSWLHHTAGSPIDCAGCTSTGNCLWTTNQIPSPVHGINNIGRLGCFSAPCDLDVSDVIGCRNPPGRFGCFDAAGWTSTPYRVEF
jgi:hypothetical protein